MSIIRMLSAVILLWVTPYAIAEDILDLVGKKGVFPEYSVDKDTRELPKNGDPYINRIKALQQAALKEAGAANLGQRSVVNALRWLASVQNENGSWGLHTRGLSETPAGVANTAFALMLFLAAGETPLSKRYGDTVRRAIRWLAEYGTQNNLQGATHRRSGGYAHGIATQAICEAYGMTRITYLRKPMENCVDALIQGQMANGGFGYGYTSGQRWDLSVSSWNMQALNAARTAGSSNKKLAAAIRKAGLFCKSTHQGNGMFAYSQNGSARENMVGLGTLNLWLLAPDEEEIISSGVDRISTRHLEELKTLLIHPEKWKELGADRLYGWYYETQVMFQYFQITEKSGKWKEWCRSMERILIRAQNPDGYWEADGPGMGPTTSGRVLTTCWVASQLQVSYRYNYGDAKHFSRPRRNRRDKSVKYKTFAEYYRNEVEKAVPSK